MIRLTLACSISLATLLPGPVAAQSESLAPIRCRIAGDLDPQGLARVRISITSPVLAQPGNYFTTDQGNCPDIALPPGKFTLSLEKAGYFPLADANAIRFEIASAASFDLGRITMVRRRSISGTVTWKSGDPADRVIAHALRVRRGEAKFRPFDAILSSTNDRGEFRIDNLQPGRYVVYAYTLAFSQTLAPRLSMPVYYPGSSVPLVDSSLDLRNTAEHKDILITLDDVQGVKVGGTITSSSTVPDGAQVLVGLVIPGSTAQAFVGTRAVVGKPFELLNVPPGSYYLLLVQQSNPRRAAIHTLVVGHDPITGLNLPFTESTSIPVKANFEPSKPEFATSSSVAGTRFWVQLDAHPFDIALAKLGDSNQSKLESILLGQTYTLTVDPPPGAYVVQVLQGGKTLPGSPYSITEGAGEIEVILSDKVSTVRGAASLPEGSLAPAFIVLAPRDRTKGHLYRTTQTRETGLFELESVAPGEYDLYAFDANEEDAYLDEPYLKKYAEHAVKLTIAGAPSAIAAPPVRVIPTRK